MVDWLCATRPVHTVVRFNGGAQAAHNVVLRDGRHAHVRAVRRRARSARRADPPVAVHGGGPAGAGRRGRPPRHGRRARRARPAHRRPGRAAGHAVPPGRQPGPGARPGRRPARLVRAWAWARPSRTRSPTPTTRPGSATAAAPAVLRRKLAALRDRLHRRARPAGRAAGRGLLPRRSPAFAARVRDRRPVLPGRGCCARGTVRLRGRAGGAAGRVARLPPVHDLEHHDLRQRRALLAEAGRPATRRGSGVLRACHHPARAGPAGHRGPGAAVAPTRTTRPNPWQGAFRFGHFDAVAHRYALEVAGGVDGLALTHLDLAGPELRICRRYDDLRPARPRPARRPGPAGRAHRPPAALPARCYDDGHRPTGRARCRRRWARRWCSPRTAPPPRTRPGPCSRPVVREEGAPLTRRTGEHGGMGDVLDLLHDTVTSPWVYLVIFAVTAVDALLPGGTGRGGGDHRRGASRPAGAQPGAGDRDRRGRRAASATTSPTPSGAAAARAGWPGSRRTAGGGPAPSGPAGRVDRRGGLS